MGFSIITPSFNQLAHLERCAASVAGQMCNGTIEHIIQDGGTGDEYAAWADSQSFAKCYQERDQGMYDAINRGFAKSGGEILAWLNCDEQYLPGTLSKVEEYFDSHPDVDLLFGDIIVCDAELRPVCYRRAMSPWRSHIKRCFMSNYSAATFVRRKVFEDGNLLDISYKAIADAVWIHGLLGRGYKYGVLAQPLSLFVLTGQNLGCTPAAALEAQEWGGRKFLGVRLQVMLLRIIYHFRKLLTGGYRGKKISFSYYVNHPPEVSQFSGILGGRWPRNSI